MHNHYVSLMTTFEVENLKSLKTNMRLKNNKIYIKSVNRKFMNCKIDKAIKYYVYYKTQLYLQAQYKNF